MGKILLGWSENECQTVNGLQAGRDEKVKGVYRMFFYLHVLLCH